MIINTTWQHGIVEHTVAHPPGDILFAGHFAHTMVSNSDVNLGILTKGKWACVWEEQWSPPPPFKEALCVYGPGKIV